MGSALPWAWFRETDEDGCGLRSSSSNAFMQGCFSWDPHPALAYDQGICEGNTLQIAGSRVREDTAGRVYCRGTAVGEMRAAAAGGSGSPAERSDAEAE